MEHLLWFGILLISTLLGVSFLIAWKFEWELWTVASGITIISLALFYFPHLSYTWKEWFYESSFVWLGILFIYGSIFLYRKVTTNTW